MKWIKYLGPVWRKCTPGKVQNFAFSKVQKIHIFAFFLCNCCASGLHFFIHEIFCQWTLCSGISNFSMRARSYLRKNKNRFHKQKKTKKTKKKQKQKTKNCSSSTLLIG